MRVYAIINLNEKEPIDKVTLYYNENEAFNWFEHYVKDRELDEDKIDEYVNEMNYKNQVFLIEKDIPTAYFTNLSEFLKFTSLMDDLGLDTQTAIRIYVKKCLATQSIPFEIK